MLLAICWSSIRLSPGNWAARICPGWCLLMAMLGPRGSCESAQCYKVCSAQLLVALQRDQVDGVGSEWLAENCFLSGGSTCASLPWGMMQQRRWGSMPVCLMGAGAGLHALSHFTDLPLLRAFMCYVLEQVLYQPKSRPLFFNSFICCSAEWNLDTKKNWIPLLYEGKLS